MGLTPKHISQADDGNISPNFILDEDDRSTVAHNEFSEVVPVISIAGMDGARRVEICREIAAACQEWGMFQVVDHGVDPVLVSDMVRLAKEFFALPDEEKLRFDMSGGKNGGFIVSSHIQDEAVANWREMVAYAPYPLKIRDYTRWPDKPEEWRAVTEAYSESMMGLAHKLLGALSESMGLDKEALIKACGEVGQRIAVNYYPKCPRPDLAIGLKRHTDAGTITLLSQDQVGGLQATWDKGQTWKTIKPIEGAFVVNLGDHAYYMSNGRFKNVDHCAVVNSNCSRLSIATFQNPNQQAIVYPLKIEDGDTPILEKPIIFAEVYKRNMAKNGERDKLKKLVREEKLGADELEERLKKNLATNSKSLEEILA